MIHVIASIHIKQGKLADIHKIYQSFVPKVKQEKGCFMYCPTADYETQIATQHKESHCITVIEQWQDLDCFHAHLNAPHVLAFRQDIQGIVEQVSIKVLEAIV